MRAVLVALTIAIVGSNLGPARALQAADGHVALVVVELGSRPKRPVGSATVRLLDGGGQVLARGITATDGTYETTVRMADPLIVEWSKKGYAGNPERKTVTGGGATVTLELDLIRTSGDQAYFRAVARDIKVKAEATGGADVAAAYKEQFARVGELPADAQRAIASELREMGVKQDLRPLEVPKQKPGAVAPPATPDRPLTKAPSQTPPIKESPQVKERPQTQDRLKMQERQR